MDEKKNGGWPINGEIFETVTVDESHKEDTSHQHFTNYTFYSIFGRNNIGSLNLGLTNYKTVREFTGSYSESNIVLKNSRGKPLFVGFGYVNTTDAIVKGNILATTCSFLRYCNDIYQPSAVFDTANSNSGAVSTIKEPFVTTSAIERTV